MRIGKDTIVRGVGSLNLTCESLDDMWLLYNLIQVGDRIKSSTHRKVAVGSSAGTSERVFFHMEVAVTELLFDPEQAEIRAQGRVCSEHENVKLGAFHTLELAQHQTVTVHKDGWDAEALAAVHGARGNAGLGAVELVALMLEAGSAQVCAVSRGLTVVRGRVEASIPKKRSGDSRHAEAMQQFFEAVLAALVRSTDWERGGSGSGGGGGGGGGGGDSPAAAAPTPVPTLLIASPGSIKDAFRDFLREAVASRAGELRGLGKARVLCAPAAAGSKWALAEALADPAVAAALGDLQASSEVALMGAWQALLAKDPERAQYGWRHCAAAADRGAVEHLLVSDRLARVGGRAARDDVLALCDRVRRSKGKVSVLSSMHASGEELCGMGGLVAVLRNVVHDLEEAAAEQAGAPGLRSGGGEGGGGGGGGGTAQQLLQQQQQAAAAPMAGHRLQEAAAAPAPRSGGADKFGVAAFDTDSDNSVDSDA